MQAYDYEALTESGKTRRGTVMATTARAARRDLKTKGLTPLAMTESQAHTRKSKDKPTQITGRVKTRFLTQATRQLAILIRADTPVVDALQITALQFEGSPMRASLLGVRSQVLEGRRLSEALGVDKKTYSELYRSMVASGENNGQLSAVLERLAEDLEAAQKTRRKIVGATIYPIILSIVALAVITILMVMVVPKVVEQFSGFNQELPKLTKLTIALSEWLQAYGLWLGAFIVGIGALSFQALKQEKLRRVFDRFILSIPFFGRLNRDMNAARFSRTMSGLLDSGTPTLQAIGTAKNTLKNLCMREAMEDVVEQVRGGSSVGGALKKTTVFPPLMVHMVAGGEASGDLGKMFSVSAEYLEGEFDNSTTIVLNLLEPMIIILLGGVVLLIVAAIFLPILRLNTLAF